MTSGRRLRMLTVAGLLVGAVALSVGRGRTRRSIDRRVDDLLGPAGRRATELDLADELADLPSPVQRYLAAVLDRDRAPPRTVRLQQSGSFLLGDEWRPMKATQHATVDPPGFVWDATITAAPFLPVRVVDAYEEGTGSLRALALGVLPVADAASSPEMDHGELLRYLAESVWLPTALLPSNGVTWDPVDGRSARATVVDSGTAASLVFHFGADDLVERVVADRRYRRDVDTFSTWQGHFGEYEWHDGVRIPTEGSVEWISPEGTAPYWCARVTRVLYDLTDPDR